MPQAPRYEAMGPFLFIDRTYLGRQPFCIFRLGQGGGFIKPTSRGWCHTLRLLSSLIFPLYQTIQCTKT